MLTFNSHFYSGHCMNVSQAGPILSAYLWFPYQQTVYGLLFIFLCPIKAAFKRRHEIPFQKSSCRHDFCVWARVTGPCATGSSGPQVTQLPGTRQRSVAVPLGRAPCWVNLVNKHTCRSGRSLSVLRVQVRAGEAVQGAAGTCGWSWVSLGTHS